MKLSLTHTSILAYADADGLYELHVNASREGHRRILYKERNGNLMPDTYVSGVCLKELPCPQVRVSA